MAAAETSHCRKRDFQNILVSCLIITALLGSIQCSRSRWLLKDVPEEQRKIYRKIRFIITRQERKEFFHLTSDEDREKFYERFWKKRDPDPETAENEFREEYMARIERADHLYSHEGREGWDTDRGRVHILLGPPDFRESYPMGYSMYDNPSEVWWYGNLPVVFIDRNRSGSMDLTSLGARYLSILLKSSEILKPEISDKKQLYGFSLGSEKLSGNQIRLVLNFPTENIYFKKFSTTYYSDVDIHLDIRMTGSGEHWSVNRKRRISVQKKDGIIPQNTQVEIPLNLKGGTYIINVNLENRENNIKVSRKIKVKI